MLKNFLAAVILGVFVLSAQIAAAAPPIDWSKVKRKVTSRSSPATSRANNAKVKTKSL